MTGDQLAAAITALVPRQAYVSNSDSVGNVSGGVRTKTFFTLPAEVKLITFNADSSSAFFTQIEATSSTRRHSGSNYIELVDSGGNVAVVVQNDVNNQAGTSTRAVIGFIYDGNARTVRICEPGGARSISLPSAFNTSGAIVIRSRFIPVSGSLDDSMYAQMVGMLTYI